MNCSFCNHNHDISNCDDIRIINFEEGLIRWRQNNLGIMHDPTTMHDNTIHDYLLQFHESLLIAFAKKKGMIGGNIFQAYPYICNLYVIPQLDTLPSYMNEETPNFTQVLSDESDEISDGLPDLIEVSSEEGESPDFIPFRTNNYILDDEPERVYSGILNQWILFGRNEMQQIHVASTNIKWKIKTQIQNQKQIQKQIEENISTNTCECGICYEDATIHNRVTLFCQHESCDGCFIQQLKACRENIKINGKRIHPNCAFCRTPIKSVTLRNETILAELQEYIET